MNKVVYSGALGLLLLVFSCKEDPELPNPEKPIVFEVPAGFPAPTYDMVNNPISTAGFVLGRKLFYDVQLSRDGSTSCGSCHVQYSAFTHHGHALSHGIDNKLGTRNAPPVMNTAWTPLFMWDGGVIHLDLFPIAPITNPVEMDETMPNVLSKLRADAEYPLLFEEAFGSDSIDGARMFKALSQFMNMLVSANSRYDKWKRNEGETLSTDELAGYSLFQQKCAACHSTELFTDGSFHNNGLDTTFFDLGRELITLNPADRAKFKTPSLRNIEKTTPYMHNGRFKTLERVIDHYRSEVKLSPTLDQLLQQNATPGIAISDLEKQQLIAFLKTLTDDEFIHDTRFSEQ